MGFEVPDRVSGTRAERLLGTKRMDVNWQKKGALFRILHIGSFENERRFNRSSHHFFRSPIMRSSTRRQSLPRYRRCPLFQPRPDVTSRILTLAISLWAWSENIAPTRIRSGVTPLPSCSSSVSCRCVVVAGWITSVFASPISPSTF
jgi:hypothetical protein